MRFFKNNLKNSVHLRIPLFILLALSFACGNEGDYYRLDVRQSMEGTFNEPNDIDYSAWLTYSEFPRDTRCTPSENITPRYDNELDGRGFYHLCKTSQSNSIYYFNLKNNLESSVCIFPAYYGKVKDTIDQFSYYTFTTPGLTPATPFSVCINPSSQKETYIDFIAALNLVPGSQIDAAFIVPFASRAQMAQCLSAGNPFLCPKAYSFGVIK